MGRKPKNQPDKLFMSPADMQNISADVFGDMWRTGLGEYMGISYSQIHRYMTLDQDIPKSLALGLVMLKGFKAADIPFPNLEEFMIDRGAAEPIRHVQIKKDKPERPRNDAPEAAFSFGDAEEAEEPEAAPEPAPEPETPIETKAARDARKKREKRAAEKAAKLAKPVKAAKPKAKPAPAKKAAKKKAA